MANIIPLHRHSLPAANGSYGGTASDGHANQARRPSPMSPTTIERLGKVRQPTADELLNAASQFPGLYLVRGPRDYAAPFTFIPSPPSPPTFGERLVETVRRWQFAFWIACYFIAVGSAAYFAVQVARGWL